MPLRWTEADAKTFFAPTKKARQRSTGAAPIGYPCTELLFLVLPYPPLNNVYYRHVGHRVLLSSEGRIYRKAVAQTIQYECPKHVLRPFDNFLTCTLAIFPSVRQHPDIDAPLKAPLDAMEHAGLYLKDKQIVEMHIYRYPPAGSAGRLEVTITPYTGKMGYPV